MSSPLRFPNSHPSDLSPVTTESQILLRLRQQESGEVLSQGVDQAAQKLRILGGERNSVASESSRVSDPRTALQRQWVETQRQLRFSVLQAETHVPEDPQGALIHFEELEAPLGRAEEHYQRSLRILTALERLGADPAALSTDRGKLEGFALRITRLQQVAKRPSAIESLPAPDSGHSFLDIPGIRTSRRLEGQVLFALDEGARALTRYAGENFGAGIETYYEGAFDNILRVSLTPALISSPWMVNENFHLVRAGAPSIRPALWQSVLHWADLEGLEAQGISVPHEHLNSYEDFTAYMREQGIEHPERIHNLHHALILLHNSRHPERLGRDRPIAVVVMGTSDWNGAGSRQSMIENLVESGRFDVVYVEAHSPEHMMRRLRGIYNESGRPIHSLVVMGHGSPNSLRFGEFSRLYTEDIRLEESGAVTSTRLADLDRLISGDGQVLLASCRLAEAPEELPEEDYPNLATAWAALLPGRRIHASTTANGTFSLGVRPDHSIDMFSLINSAVVLRAESEGSEVESLSIHGDMGWVPACIGPLLGGISEFFA